MRYIRCQDCKELKPLEAFPPKVTNRTGRRGICSACRPPEPEPSKPEPPPARVVYAMCGKKHRYPTEGVALAAALRSARRTRQMRVYLCPLCNGYHLTHKPARQEATR